MLNAPFHAELPNRIFTVESVYALIEAKSTLTPSELVDAVAKGRRFKAMTRHFSEVTAPKIQDSLFIIFAFEAAAPNTFRDTVASALNTIPGPERPDFIVVANSLVVTAGSYFELSKLGKENSAYRRELLQKPLEPALARALAQGFQVGILGEHALMAFFMWLTSWLVRAGYRTADLHSYLPEDMSFQTIP
jgi:hypothetical protein